MVPSNVNWAKLKRTIERDFKRNPAKTGVLLALLPVAGYFIVPLFWKMLPTKASDSATTGSVALAPAVTPGQSPNATAEKKDSFRWHDVAAQIAGDPRMTPAAIGGLRNPFEGQDNVSNDLAEMESEPKQPEPDPLESSRPEDFGLQLTATIVGDRVKLATINGKQYREHSRLPISQPSEGAAAATTTTDAAFIVKSVAKKFVVLEREGRLYQLQLSR